MENHRVITCCILAITGTVLSVFSGTRDTYLLISNPSSLTIFNQYEQPIGESERGLFTAYTPLRIIEKDALLGDQISHAMRVGLYGKTYFLLHDEEGAFAGEKKPFRPPTIRNCETLGDTIHVIGAGLKLAGPSGTTVSAEKGDRLVRLFRSGNRYYVACITCDRVAYGWSTLTPARSWRADRTQRSADVTADTLFPASLRGRILARMNRANESYKELFSHFSSETGDDRAAPAWHCTHTDVSLTCRLKGPYSIDDELAASTRHLKRDLEIILLGSGFWLTVADGGFVIRRETADK
ncbi:MAG: hypothetical protein JW768_07345 [Chitinispirillaceae bacterium]|nr:hypothetical protein [Chitinispirillaceae bacterium]